MSRRYNTEEDKRKLLGPDGKYDWNAFGDRMAKALKMDCLAALIIAVFLGTLAVAFVKFNF